MKLIDTHTHLYLEQFTNDLDEVVQRAQQAGISNAILPNIDSQSIDALKTCVASNTVFFKPMMGIHPCSIKANWEKELAIAQQELVNNSYCGIGEIGLDYHWDLSYVEEQKKAFAIQLEWAKEMNLPVSVHSRKAYDDLLKIIQKAQDGRLRGVLHCFGGDKREAEIGIDLGFALGIGGVVTYKNSGMAEIVKHVGIDHLVLETDAPYLPPVPYRGQRNESAYIYEIASFVAQILRLSTEEVAAITSKNASTLFSV